MTRLNAAASIIGIYGQWIGLSCAVYLSGLILPVPKAALLMLSLRLIG